MKTFSSMIAAVILAAFSAAASSAALSPPAPPSASAPKEPTLTAHTVTGPFDVTLTSQPASEAAAAAGVARMSIKKTFHGELEGTSSGEMLAFRSTVDGSAGYVAMETVQGTLQGRTGTFVLQHSSTMDKGQPRQSIIVVPDSGTGALTGLTGSMTIDIAAGGKHAYRFEFRLPSAAK